MHITSSKGGIVPFSQVSWEKYKQCLSVWKNLGCNEGETAKKMMQLLLPVLNTDISLNEYRSLPIAETYSGYHRECYIRFTDKGKLQRAVKRKTEADALNSGNLTFPFRMQDEGYKITSDLKIGSGYHI